MLQRACAVPINVLAISLMNNMNINDVPQGLFQKLEPMHSSESDARRCANMQYMAASTLYPVQPNPLIESADHNLRTVRAKLYMYMYVLTSSGMYVRQ